MGRVPTWRVDTPRNTDAKIHIVVHHSAVTGTPEMILQKLLDDAVCMSARAGLTNAWSMKTIQLCTTTLPTQFNFKLAVVKVVFQHCPWLV